MGSELSKAPSPSPNVEENPGFASPPESVAAEPESPKDQAAKEDVSPHSDKVPKFCGTDGPTSTVESEAAATKAMGQQEESDHSDPASDGASEKKKPEVVEPEDAPKEELHAPIPITAQEAKQSSKINAAACSSRDGMRAVDRVKKRREDMASRNDLDRNFRKKRREEKKSERGLNRNHREKRREDEKIDREQLTEENHLRHKKNQALRDITKGNRTNKTKKHVWYKAGDLEAPKTEAQKAQRCYPRMIKSRTHEVKVKFLKAQSINNSTEKITHTVPLSHIHLEDPDRPVSTGWSLWRRRRLTRAEVATPVGLNAQDD